MRISLSEIMTGVNGGSTSKEMSVMPELESFSYDGSDYGFISKEPVQIKISKVSPGSLRFTAHTHCVLAAECSRCLEPVELPFDIDTDNELVIDADGSAGTRDDDEKLSYIEGHELDVDGFLKEELMIGFPLQVLCSEECRGLCPKCGANLNKGECGCDRTVSDPRMSIIRDLFPDL